MCSAQCAPLCIKVQCAWNIHSKVFALTHRWCKASLQHVEPLGLKYSCNYFICCSKSCIVFCWMYTVRKEWEVFNWDRELFSIYSRNNQKAFIISYIIFPSAKSVLGFWSASRYLVVLPATLCRGQPETETDGQTNKYWNRMSGAVSLTHTTTIRAYWTRSKV